MEDKKMMNKCSYTPGTKDPHKQCTHKHYCIFNTNRKELENNISQLQNELHQFEHIKHCYINGEIIYHEDLDDYYNIELIKYTDGYGVSRIKTSVNVTEGFIGRLNTKIKNLTYDLKNLEKFKIDVIHKKVDGFGGEVCE